jgi:peptide-methionine (R)-S-oxide reductase
MDKVQKTDEEWRSGLTGEQFNILRNKATEPAFTGALLHNKDAGSYACAACGNEIFSSNTKFDSGSGWPSFWAPMDRKKVELHEDNSYGMRRIEVTCARCGGHLGHLFPDGPEPSGERYCINSAALNFKKKDSTAGPEQ